MYIGSSSNLKQRLINQRCFLKTGHRNAIAALKNQKINIDDFNFRVLLETTTVEEAKEIVLNLTYLPKMLIWLLVKDNCCLK
jgi:hypothetical protein